MFLYYLAAQLWYPVFNFKFFRVHSEANVTGYSPGKVPTAEVNAYLYSKSPVAYINNIKAPTMVLVSGKDKRVPPSQGTEFYKGLLYREIKSRLDCLFPSLIIGW